MKKCLAILVLVLSACNPVDVVAPSYRDTSVPITSKAAFDPARYAGTWYEIARFPVPFQTGCRDVTATYTPMSNGGFHVVNTCQVDGAERQIEGFADIVGPGRLRVSFETVPFVKAPYWVLWVDEDYQTAVVGVPSGRAGWILNRSPVLRADRLKAAREILDFNGYDLNQLRMTLQREGGGG
ncbi:MAG: lipocalin family protein [Pseudomonadota bacterium]